MIPEDDRTPDFTWKDRLERASLYLKVYMTVVFIHAVSLIVLGVISLVHSQIEHVYGYTSFFITICFVSFSIYGSLTDNYLLVAASILSAILISVYIVWYMVTDSDDNHTSVLVLASISCVCSVIYIILAVPLYKEFKFGWYRYEKLKKADESLQSMFLTFQMFQSIVWIDIEMVLLFFILTVSLLKHSILGFVFNFALPVLLQLIFAAILYYSVKRERLKIVKFVSIISCFILIVYAAVNMYWVADGDFNQRQVSPTQFQVTGALLIIVKFALALATYRAMFNFHQGLTQYIMERGSISVRNSIIARQKKDSQYSQMIGDNKVYSTMPPQTNEAGATSTDGGLLKDDEFE